VVERHLRRAVGSVARAQVPGIPLFFQLWGGKEAVIQG
jgi:hypothetical protein